MTPPRLELRRISVSRGGRVVLQVEALALQPGEVLAVLGPNGAGKSTLLQVAGLLLRPDAGEVWLNGVPVKRPGLQLRRRLAVALQEPLLLQGTVLENVALGLKLRGVPGRERNRRALAWLDRFGIVQLSGRPARRLSGGEAQRASLARAFAIGPELLLLDEPFSGLDEPTRDALVDDLRGVIVETGVSAVFVTHDRNEALRIADSAALLIGGRLRQTGPLAEVFAAPADEDVAAFVGVETVVPGRVLDSHDGLVRVEAGDQVLTAVSDHALGREVRICIRPEDVVLQSLRNEGLSSSARNLLRARVLEVQPRGAQARVVLDCSFRLIALITRVSAEELGIEAGTEVAAAVKASAIHLLPGDRQSTRGEP